MAARIKRPRNARPMQGSLADAHDQEIEEVLAPLEDNSESLEQLCRRAGAARSIRSQLPAMKRRQRGSELEIPPEQWTAMVRLGAQALAATCELLFPRNASQLAEAIATRVLSQQAKVVSQEQVKQKKRNKAYEETFERAMEMYEKSVKQSTERRTLRALLSGMKLVFLHDHGVIRNHVTLVKGRQDYEYFMANRQLAPEQKGTCERFDQDAVKGAVDFIYSSQVSKFLASGQRYLCLGDGGEETIVLPAVVRKVNTKNAYALYVEHQKRNAAATDVEQVEPESDRSSDASDARDGEDASDAVGATTDEDECSEGGTSVASGTSFHRIMKAITSHQDEPQRCVDSVLEDTVNDTFSRLGQIVHKYITPEESLRDELLQQLECASNFLKWHYDDHVERDDSCVTHGLDYALAAPDVTTGGEPSNHTQADCAACAFPFAFVDSLRERCENEQWADAHKNGTIKVLTAAPDKFRSYMAHRVRSLAQQQAIAKVRDGMRVSVANDGGVQRSTVLCVVDYRLQQKENAQPLHSGKPGVSWHGAMFEWFEAESAKDGNTTAVQKRWHFDQLVSGTTDQGVGPTVTLIEAALTRAVQEHPWMAGEDVTIVSDNASNYQNPAVVIALGMVSKNGPMRIRAHIHTDTADGQSELDAHFGRCSAKLEHLLPGADANANAGEICEALLRESESSFENARADVVHLDPIGLEATEAMLGQWKEGLLDARGAIGGKQDPWSLFELMGRANEVKFRHVEAEEAARPVAASIDLNNNSRAGDVLIGFTTYEHSGCGVPQNYLVNMTTSKFKTWSGDWEEATSAGDLAAAATRVACEAETPGNEDDQEGEEDSETILQLPDGTNESDAAQPDAAEARDHHQGARTTVTKFRFLTQCVLDQRLSQSPPSQTPSGGKRKKRRVTDGGTTTTTTQVARDDGNGDPSTTSQAQKARGLVPFAARYAAKHYTVDVQAMREGRGSNRDVMKQGNYSPSKLDARDFPPHWAKHRARGSGLLSSGTEDYMTDALRSKIEVLCEAGVQLAKRLNASQVLEEITQDCGMEQHFALPSESTIRNEIGKMLERSANKKARTPVRQGPASARKGAASSGRAKHFSLFLETHELFLRELIVGGKVARRTAPALFMTKFGVETGIHAKQILGKWDTVKRSVVKGTTTAPVVDTTAVAATAVGATATHAMAVVD